MSRVRTVFLLVLTWASCVYAARESDFNADLFCGWDGYYRPMEWTPVEVTIGADLTEPFDGSFTLTAQQDGLNTLHVFHKIVLTPNQSLPLPLVTKFAYQMSQCTLTIRDKRGRTRWQFARDTWDFSDPTPLLRAVQENDLLLGVVGQPRFGLLRLGEGTVCMSARGSGNVCVGTKAPLMTPWDWTGFASLDLLILYDPDWTLLNAQQHQAICDWVSNGGSLLLVLGRHPLPPGSPLGRLVPFDIGELRACEVPAPILSDLGLDASGSQKVTAWSLSAKPGSGLWQKVELPDAGCLYGVGHAGFGRVAVLGFDPSGLSAGQTQRTAEFWTSQVAACLEERVDTPATAGTSRSLSVAVCRRTIAIKPQTPQETVPKGYRQNQYRISIAQNAGNRVMEHLYQLRQMRPLSIWWVILTLSALAVLLGPVDYFVLKKVDKLPYTWLTSTGWIVLFTVGAYYGVQHLRGGTMQLRAVSVLDSVADSNCAWATYYAGLFAPRNDNYQLEGLRPNQWWTAVAPSQAQIWGYQREAGMRQLTCVQEDGSNLPVSVPVNIWTVQSLLGECPLDRAPFVARVRRTRSTATVEIANASDRRIARGLVLWADRYADLGPIAAGSTQTFEVSMRPFDAWRDGPSGGIGYVPAERVPRYPPVLGGLAESAFLAQGCFGRTLAMHDYLKTGAAVVCVMFEGAPAPFRVSNRAYETDHIQYARQLVPDRGE
jgi:hypothetical protein